MTQHKRLVSVMTVLAVSGWLFASTVRADESRCVAVDLYLHSQDSRSEKVRQTVGDFVKSRPGLSLSIRDLDGPDAAIEKERLTSIARHFHFDPEKTPVVYACNRVIVGTAEPAELLSQLQAMLRIDVYVRSGCSRCARAKPFINGLRRRYVGFEIRERDLVTDRVAQQDLANLVRRHQQAAASVPVFHLCNQLVVGFDQEATTGRRIEKVLDYWTFACRADTDTDRKPETGSHSSGMSRWAPPGKKPNIRTAAFLVPVRMEQADDVLHSKSSAPPPIVPLPGDHEDPLSSPAPLPESIAPTTDDSIDVPLFGRLSASQLGLPLFTIGVGLVDGFNPCAMWVLLFLLSILVNLKSRTRILAVAGVFVLISGLAYFAFMAAWLNVFRFVGLLRPVQITLAIIAIAVGAIHIKDFFAFKKGVTLSIPESAKPGIYARVRRIATAENLTGAIIGASVLAVMVNIIELLCTAGLPALYTEVLTMQQLAAWQNYAYLALYNVAYMFDDSLMIAVVVTTLGRHKMQQRHGQRLKLLSGTVILLLGLVMLIKPEWLL